MFNQQRFNRILTQYKQEFTANWPREKFKWTAVKIFQDNWNIDAVDFAEMLERSLSGGDGNNLLVARSYFPARMIKMFAERYPERVRSMFRALFDESTDVGARIQNFTKASENLLPKYVSETGAQEGKDYQDAKAVSTYLFLRYPTKYYIFGFREATKSMNNLEFDKKLRRGNPVKNIEQTYKFYDEIRDRLNNDKQLISLLHANLDSDCYSDKQHIILTLDFAHYVALFREEVVASQDVNYWWLNANPKEWSFTQTAVGDEVYYTLSHNGVRRKIYPNFLNAKVGDIVIGYETSPMRKIVALCTVSRANDGEKIYFRKECQFDNPIPFDDVKNEPVLQQMEFLAQQRGTFYRLTSNEFQTIISMLRSNGNLFEIPSQEMSYTTYTKEDFLKEVYMLPDEYDDIIAVLKDKKNIILQGAPGVGKTFAAQKLAYALMGVHDDSRVKIVQFHQNYTYEDFVIGYKPDSDGFKLKEGIFYKICNDAQLHPDKDYILIIDEINRGNLSKIFGELLMLIENNYRSGMCEGVCMAYSGIDNRFVVPCNLYIIGLMNTSDRSLQIMDYALRRRFGFVNMRPGYDTAGFVAYQQGLKNEKFDKLVQTVKDLNAEISADDELGPGFCIGHSYLCGMTAQQCTDARLRRIIKYDLIPTIEEYWRLNDESREKWVETLNSVLK